MYVFVVPRDTFLVSVPPPPPLPFYPPSNGVHMYECVCVCMCMYIRMFDRSKYKYRATEKILIRMCIYVCIYICICIYRAYTPPFKSIQTLDRSRQEVIQL